MPRPRFAKLDTQKQQRILDVATDEFTAHGFGGSSYNRIIEKSGLSKGVMYYYFDNKEDLFITVLKHALSVPPPPNDLFAEVETVSQFWASTAALLQEVSQVLLRDPRKAQLLRHYTSTVQSTQMREAYADIESTMNAWSTAFFACGQNVGAIRTDMPLPLLMTIALHVGQAADLWLLEQGGELNAEVLAQYGVQMLDLFQRMLHPQVTFCTSAE